MKPSVFASNSLVVLMLLTYTVSGSYINTVVVEDESVREANKEVKNKHVTRSNDCRDFGDDCGLFSGCCEGMTCQYDSWTSGLCWYDW